MTDDLEFVGLVDRRHSHECRFALFIIDQEIQQVRDDSDIWRDRWH